MYKVYEQVIHRIQTANRRIKRCSTLLVSSKMTIKTAMKDQCQILAKIWGREHVYTLLMGEEMSEDFLNCNLAVARMSIT